MRTLLLFLLTCLTAAPVSAQINAFVAPVNPNCFGASNGSISIVNPTPAGLNFEFTIDGRTWATQSSYTGLPIGVYDVRMRVADDTTRMQILDAALELRQPAQLDAVVRTIGATACSMGDTITITNVSGGSGEYEISIDGGVSYSPYQANFNGLWPGAYDVWIRDARVVTCARFLKTVMLGAVNGNMVVTNVSQCAGNNNGTITINAVGGSGMYEYTINGGIN